MQFYTKSDCGKVRLNNEDSSYIGIEEYGMILVVADGMGGHQAGEIASSKAVITIVEHLRERLSSSATPECVMNELRVAVEKANDEVLEVSSSSSKYHGMGTTVDVCVIIDSSAYVAHVGDSRVYRVSNEGAIVQITRDHSLVQYLIESGTITPEEAETHPQRHIITRALGTSDSVEADTYISKFQEGDTILLCTDGLTSMISNEEIARIVMAEKEPDKAVNALIDAANDAGGHDNITIVMVCK